MNLMQFSPATDEVRRLQEITAWILMVILLVSFIIALYMLKYRSKSHEQRRQLQTIRPQVLSGGSQKTFVHCEDSPEVRKRKLERVLDGSEPNITGLREGIASIQSEVSRSFPSLPIPILRGIFEAIGLIALALIIALGTISVDGWIMPSGGDATGLVTVIEWVVLAVILVGILSYQFVSLFPGGEHLIALQDPGTAIVVSLGLAALLLALSMVLRRDPDGDVNWFPRLEPGRLLAAALFWVTKVAALIVITVLSVTVLIDGYLLNLILSIYAGGPLLWIAAIASTVVLWSVFSVVVPDAASNIGTAIQRECNSVVVRTRLILIGAPILATGLTVLVLLSFTGSIRVTILGALLMVLVSRGVLHIWTVVKYRSPAVAEPDQQIRELPVTATTIEDADGELIHILTVDGYPLAHRDRDELLSTGLDACSWRLDGPDLQSDDVTALIERLEHRTPPRDLPAVEHYYYERAIGQGIVDFDDVRKTVRGDIETRVKRTLEKHGGKIPRERIVRELQHEYPADMVQESMEFLEKKVADVSSNQGTLMLR